MLVENNIERRRKEALSELKECEKMLDAEIEEDIIDRPVVVGKGPKAYTIMEWNRQTREMFDKGKIPKQGRRFCLKCVRFDGKRAYFKLSEI